MEKVIHNLLTQNTATPIQIIKNATEQFTGPRFLNESGPRSKMYVQISGIAVGGTGFIPKLYSSFNGYSWFLHSTNSPYIAALTTSASRMYDFPHVGNYIRMGYIANSTVSAVRCILETEVYPKSL